MNWQVFHLNDAIYKLGRGAAQKNLDVKAFAELSLTFPEDKNEQQRIVGILDAAFEKIDALKANAEKMLAECDALKQSILRQAFNGEL